MTMEDAEATLELFTNSDGNYTDEKYVYKQKIDLEKLTHENNINEEYMQYLNTIDKSLVDGISFTRLSVASMNLLVKNDKVKMVNFGSSLNSVMTIPKIYNNENTYLTNNYDLLYGNYPSNANDVLLVVNSNNEDFSRFSLFVFNL